jgi:type IV pilus assembly protein PilA
MRARKWFSRIAKLTVISASLAVIVSVSVPYFMKQVQVSYETGAIQQIKLVQRMQARYYSQFGRYASSLRELGPPPGNRTGYLLELRATPNGYAVTAVPEKPGSTGCRTFYSDQDNAIRQNWSREPADVNSPEILTDLSSTLRSLRKAQHPPLPLGAAHCRRYPVSARP